MRRRSPCTLPPCAWQPLWSQQGRLQQAANSAARACVGRRVRKCRVSGGASLIVTSMPSSLSPERPPGMKACVPLGTMPCASSSCGARGASAWAAARLPGHVRAGQKAALVPSAAERGTLRLTREMGGALPEGTLSRRHACPARRRRLRRAWRGDGARCGKARPAHGARAWLILATMAAAPCRARARVSSSIGAPGRKPASAVGAAAAAPSRNWAGTAAWMFTAGCASTGPCAVMTPAAPSSAADGVPMPPRALAPPAWAAVMGTPSGAATSHFRRLRPSMLAGNKARG